MFLYLPDYENQWLDYVGTPWFFEKDANGFSAYHHYLQSKTWKSRRKIKLKSVGYRCEECKVVEQKGVKLQIHHKTYERVTQERLSDLQVLCEDCHKAKHRIED